jgi:hypothetical protein
MAAKKKQAKTATTTVKSGKLYLRLFFAFLLSSVVKYIFFTRVTIGDDKRYFIFIFLFPVITGLVVMLYLWRKRVIGDIRETKGFPYKVLLGFLFFLMGIFCSYISFGLAADSIWEITNRRTALSSPEENFRLRVDKFYFGKNERVEFKFRNKAEKIRCSYKAIAAYRNNPPDRYTINLTVQKGIWGCYIINSWYIAEQDNE